MKRHAIFPPLFGSLLLLISYTGRAQIFIKGLAYDKETNAPLRDVVVYYNHNTAFAVTDTSGNFSLRSDSLQDSLVFKKSGYTTYKLLLKKEMANNKLKIFLEDKMVQLEEISVSAGKINVVVQNKLFYIVDYYFLPDASYLIISYKSLRSEFDVSIIDRQGKILSRKTIYGEDAKKIVKDCYGKIYVLSNRNAREVIIDAENALSLSDPISNIQFINTIQKCVAKLDSELFFNDVNLSMSFFYKVKDKKNMPVRFITYDKEKSERFESHIAYEDKTKKFAESRPSARGLSRELALNSIFQPVYAPAFVQKDTLVLFNFPEMCLELYAKTGDCIYKVPIQDFSQYHNYEVKYDEIAHKYYLYQRKNLTDTYFLTEINIYTGKFVKSYKLQKPFLQCLRVYDDEIYYIVREKQSFDDTAYLYKQKM